MGMEPEFYARFITIYPRLLCVQKEVRSSFCVTYCKRVEPSCILFV
jgi:hypothetical protein